MRIVNITYTLQGGAGKAVSRLHDRLIELEIPSIIITKPENITEKPSLFNRIKNKVVSVVRKNYLLNAKSEEIQVEKELEMKYCFFSKRGKYHITF